MEKVCVGIRMNTDLVEMLRGMIGGLDGRGIEVGVLHKGRDEVIARIETDGGSVGGRIQRMKEGRSLVTESHPTDTDPDVMNLKRTIDLEDGKNDDLGGTKTRNGDRAEKVIEIETINTCIDDREGILAVAVHQRDREKDTITESQLERNTVHHIQTHQLIAPLATTKNPATILHPMT